MQPFNTIDVSAKCVKVILSQGPFSQISVTVHGGNIAAAFT